MCDMTVDVTVVICTYNRAGMLREALESLQRLETGGRYNVEILVVDNASTDATPQVIAEFGGRPGLPVRGVRESQQGVSFARNRGIEEARGPWVAFFDDDQEAAADWLLQLLATAEAKQCRVVGGAVQLAVEDAVLRHLGPVAQAMFGATKGKDVVQPYTRRFAPGTGNLLIHRSVFESVGLFDVTLAEAGEDTDLFRRIRNAGLEAWFTPAAVVFHKIPPDRLERDHLLRTAQRVGGHIARRERQSSSAGLFPLVLAARCLHAGLRDGWNWLRSRLASDPAARMDADCLAARSVGYVRNGLRELAPRLFGQAAYFSRLNFRSDRQPAANSTH